jgi:hypothetical protein
VVKEINANKGYAGFTDWRVPSPSELNSLITCPEGSQPVKFEADKTGGGCKIEKNGPYSINRKNLPTDLDSVYWSSATSKWSNMGIRVSLSSGYNSAEYKNNKEGLLLVRTSK